MNLGKKIIALLMTAVCLIGVLPLSVSAVYETVYVPPLAALTLDTRYSDSSKDFVPSTGSRNALTVPLPIDKSLEVEISFGSTLEVYTTAFYFDSNFNLLHTQKSGQVATSQITLDSSFVQDSVYVVFNIYQNTPWDNTLFINSQLVSVVEGSHLLASPERYEQIEVPDPPTPPTVGLKIQPILDMWDDILLLSVTPLTDFYNQLIEPIGLIFGIPLMMALIGIIIFAIGGKKR